MTNRTWISTKELLARVNTSRETLRQLRLRGVLRPGRDYRRWGCTNGKGPLEWHPENVDAAINGWARKNLA